MYVAMVASVSVGKIVRKPSVAAFPGLSVTPGLKPTVMTVSGDDGKASVVSSVVLVAPCSMIGSAKRSSTRASMSFDDVSPLMR